MKNHFNITNAVINGEEQPTVNARELWSALQSKRQFGNWIQDRLVGFKEGIDFTVNKIVNGENKGRFAATEYTLTLDTAKHLAMLERNEIGKKIRQYFIEFEKEARKMFDENIKFCQKAYVDKCMEKEEYLPATDITRSTIAVIEKINQQILRGEDVDKEVLRYAWNIGKLIHRPLVRAVNVPSGIAAFITCYPAGEFSRQEVYAEYCNNCAHPVSARCFWPAVRKCRPFTERRTYANRYVVFE